MKKLISFSDNQATAIDLSHANNYYSLYQRRTQLRPIVREHISTNLKAVVSIVKSITNAFLDVFKTQAIDEEMEDEYELAPESFVFYSP